MRAGLFFAYWPWFSPEEQVSLAARADELELDSVCISEAWRQDAVSRVAFDRPLRRTRAGADTLVVVPLGERRALVRMLAEGMRGAHA